MRTKINPFVRSGKWLAGVWMAGMLLVSGCSPGALAPSATPSQQAGLQQTLAAFETLAVRLTQTAPAIPTRTLVDTATPTPIPPTWTPRPTISLTRLPCNWADFVQDVSIPDGTELHPGESFIKTWRLKNLGACTWDGDYRLAYERGELFGAPTRIGLPRTVFPGETVDISVSMEAPTYPGGYAGYWRLADGAGNRFGVGAMGTEVFWVRVVVRAADTLVYDFTENYCKAVWHSGTTDPLPCPGDGRAGDTGYVLRQDHPIREDGGVEKEAGLITQPDNAPEMGKIVGVFPPILVETGDVFKAVIGCGYDTPGCNVIFDLGFRVDDGPIQTLDSWHEVYEGQMRSVNVDLSALAGREVSFVLQVRNNGTAENNQGLWILPRVMR